MIFEIINLDDIPDALPPGEYDTEVVEFEYNLDKKDYVLKVRWLNKKYSKYTCLFPLTKHSFDQTLRKS